MRQFVLNRIENIFGKGENADEENAGYQHFFLSQRKAFYAPTSKKKKSHSVCPSVTNVTCKLKISLVTSQA